MPFIRITVFAPVLDREQIRHLQQGTTDLMISIMHKPVAGTAVLVEHVDRGGWSIAGPAVSPAAHVEATIGRGTNTRDEKARFLGDMMALLRSALGPELRDETYIVLHELDHGSYGRGGLTRAERDQ